MGRGRSELLLLELLGRSVFKIKKLAVYSFLISAAGYYGQAGQQAGDTQMQGPA
jgi:hypothetical protein